MTAIRIPYESHGEDVPRWYDGLGVWLALALMALFVLALVA